ncbi:Aste57867_19697 [Aphanomyces stellatus]|uniref:Aste57867_19697 protein n=1 Tax=Aphanomyces stellatus TaxID=120398 RepID=A0A485LD66_9STRA|nr:hypothetical protein As57867_019632 [Aphanomyces stellatus]VFT96397.1 Aste57867_19697 [Aphanomyces stellatus]
MDFHRPANQNEESADLVMDEARVEGLLALLKDGQTPKIRQYAAEQLGYVVTPKTLTSFVDEMRPLLRHANWDTRVAAAQAVAFVAASPSFRGDLLSTCASLAHDTEHMMRLSTLNMKQVLVHAAPLLKSGGEEYNYEVNLSSMEDQRKHLLRQRYLLWKRISHDIQSTVNLPRPVLAQSTDDSFVDAADVTPSVHASTSTKSVVSSFFSVAPGRLPSHQRLHPLASLLLDCLEAIFDSHWEVRHGAAATLREVFVTQGAHLTIDMHHASIMEWLEEVFLRCICVLALEQYVDYSADGSVAPNRQLVAQVAGHLLTFFPHAIDATVVPLLHPSASWHACHGGLLAIHFAPRASQPSIRTVATAHVIATLDRSDDEIHAVAAQWLTLIPTLSADVLARLWALLTPAAETSVDLSPGHILDALRTHASATAMERHLRHVAPFFKHALAPVREAAIRWFETMMSQVSLDVPTGMWWLQMLWSRLLVDRDCSASLRQLWHVSIEHMRRDNLDALVDSAVDTWVESAWTLTTTFNYEDPWTHKIVHMAVPPSTDTSHAIDTMSPCLASLLMASADHPFWSTWACAWLESAKGHRVVAVLTILSMTKPQMAWPTQAVAFKVETLLRDPRVTFFDEQMPLWTLCRRVWTDLTAHFPNVPAVVMEPTTAASWQLAQVAGALPYESVLTKPEPYTQAHYLRQDLFDIEERTRVGFEQMQTNISALAAATFVAFQLAWEKPAFLVRPLMDALKTCADAPLQRHVAAAVVHFLRTFHESHSVCCVKMTANLAANLHAERTSVRFVGAQVALTRLLQSSHDDNSHVPTALWAKLATLWSVPHVPLLEIVLAHAWPTTLVPVVDDAWTALRGHPEVATAIASAAARSPPLLTHVVSKFQHELQLEVVDALARNHASVIVSVVCDLIPLAMSSFGTLAHLLPLVALTPNLAGASPFLHQLWHGQPPPLPLAALPTTLSLRPYQEAGIAWLAFLAAHQLHGVLADDMGLGKTRQVLGSIALLETQRPTNGLCVLVVCPPIVMAHWQREASTYFNSTFPRVALYAGTAAQRHALRPKQASWNAELVVTSYATLQHDSAVLTATEWTYCVADEAHLCRNPVSLTTQALLAIRAQYRVAVSGTPIQNTAVDIWSVFSFLMPGYLGNYSAFRQQTVQPILLARKDSATAAQKEAGALALTQLHAQIAPFVLRRTKDAVLLDLPPKLIQDIPCDLTPLQRKLYDDAANLPSTLATWRQRQRVCIHPCLIDAKQYAKEGAGKLSALVDLLELIQNGAHRCLLFCHTPTNVQVVQKHLHDAMPALQTLKLDGSIPASQRQVWSEIVDRFNHDHTIDVLILTTSIGGLGLTLVSADTVVFLEHSWNPFVDLQAMDRVHRLGQTKPVTVYRLLAQDTIEDEILTAQRFKQAMADTVLGPNEAKGGNVLRVLQSSLGQKDSRPTKRAKQGPRGKGGLHAFLDELEDLWDEAQYESLELPT